ncbi:family B DNA polymerase, partial [Helicosporidium sp. ATCC 50920]
MAPDKENEPLKRPHSAGESKSGDVDFFDVEDDVPEAVEEVEEGVLGEAGKNWRRPPAEVLDAQRDSLVFQQLEIDYTSQSPNRAYHQTSLAEVPVLRCFGCNQAGNSVCLYVHGFEPYFFCESPTPSFSPDDAAALTDLLNQLLAGKDRSPNDRAVLRVEVEQKQTMLFYQPVAARPFLRIVLALPGLVAPCRALVEGGLWLEWLRARLSPTTYESNVLYVLRFMVDCGLMGGSWMELPPKTYALAPERMRSSHCQVEAHCHWKSLVAHTPEGEWARLSPLRVLSLDIECQGRKGHFPEASQDPVIQIASVVTVVGEDAPRVKNVMTLKSCAPIAGAEVLSFESERELLLRWRDLLLETDPDVMTGYNILNFDLPYLLDRATALGIPQFWTWGRLRGRRAKVRDARFSSKAYGTHEYKEVSIEGRVQFDMMQAVRRDHNLSSYSLNAVSAHFLGEQKEDVHHSDISRLQDGNAETRRRLAVYCLKDALLPQRLFDRLLCAFNYIEMARVTGVPLSFLLARGQSIKVFSQILRQARTRGLLVPNVKRQGEAAGGEGYEGATVLEPKAGYYATPVATLDFASLYPSIMMAHNLCYTTLVPRAALPALKARGEEAHVREAPSGDWFVGASARR